MGDWLWGLRGLVVPGATWVIEVEGGWAMSRESRIARRLVGDYGDTQAFFNVSDFFRLKDAPDKVVLEAMRELQDVVSSMSREMNKMVRRELMRRASELLAKGLLVK